MKSIDLNSDLGEGFGVYRMGDDDGMLEIISSANIACGFHAGDPLIMHETVRRAGKRGVAIGAHPSFLDLWGFGRRPIHGERPADIEKILAYQIGALQGIAQSQGQRVTHVKTHGSLGNMAAVDGALAAAVARAVAGVDRTLILVVMPGMETERAGDAAGLRLMREVYADRTYDDNGNLTSRRQPGAVLHDPAAATARILAMVETQRITTTSGKALPVTIDSICVHGDTPDAVAMARRIRAGLEQAGYAIRPFVETPDATTLMAMTPTYALPPSFLGVTRTDRGARFCVAGIPFDVATTNRSGARFGPQAIRSASRMLVDGDHPLRWLDPARLDLADIGNFALPLGDICQSLAAIEAEAQGIEHLLALGGDHAVTLGLLRALARRDGQLALIHFDAHVDTWPESFGQAYGHGSVFYHAIEEGLVDPRHMVQIGIRSPVPRAVHDWTLGKGVTVLTAEAVHESGPAAIAARIRDVVGDRHAYLSFDIDALDPAFAPGTGTPEIGGLATWQAQAILRRLGGLSFRGMDVVEVAPPYDVAEITALAAATIAWEYLALIGDGSA